MPTKEPSSLNMSMKMWKNSVEAWDLISTRLLGQVLIQIFTHTHSHPYTYTSVAHDFSHLVSLFPFGH